MAKNKSGRPCKPIKRIVKMSAHCTYLEKAVIEGRAKAANLTISEYMRKAALNTTITVKSFPPEILKISAQLSQLAANTNSIAKQLNIHHYLSNSDLQEISTLPNEFKNLSAFIKDKLK